MGPASRYITFDSFTSPHGYSIARGDVTESSSALDGWQATGALHISAVGRERAERTARAGTRGTAAHFALSLLSRIVTGESFLKNSNGNKQ